RERLVRGASVSVETPSSIPLTAAGLTGSKLGRRWAGRHWPAHPSSIGRSRALSPRGCRGSRPLRLRWLEKPEDALLRLIREAERRDAELLARLERQHVRRLFVRIGRRQIVRALRQRGD